MTTVTHHMTASCSTIRVKEKTEVGQNKSEDKKMKNRHAILLFLLIMAIMLGSGCTLLQQSDNSGADTGTVSPSTAATQTTSDAPTPTLTPENSPSEKSGDGSDSGDSTEAPTPDAAEDSQAPAEEPEVLEVTGKYVGQVDNNFIEFELPDGEGAIRAQVFMLTDEVRDVFSSLDPQTGDPLTLRYTVNESNHHLIQHMERVIEP